MELSKMVKYVENREMRNVTIVKQLDALIALLITTTFALLISKLLQSVFL